MNGEISQPGNPREQAKRKHEGELDKGVRIVKREGGSCWTKNRRRCILREFEHIAFRDFQLHGMEEEFIMRSWNWDNGKRFGWLLALAVASWAVPGGWAADIRIKANLLSNDLRDGANWVGGVTPGAGACAVLDGPLTLSSFTLGDDLQSYQGIKLLDPGHDVTIEAGQVLTLGAGGIDMGGASRGLTLNNGLDLAVNQTFNTATTLLIAGTTSVEGSVLAIVGSGVTTIADRVAGTSSELIKAGTGTLSLAAMADVATLTMQSGVLATAEAKYLRGVLNLEGGTVSLGASMAGTLGAGLNVMGNVTVTRTGAGTISLNGTWSGGGVVNWNSSAVDSMGTASSFSGFSGTLSFGASSGSWRMVGPSDKGLGNALVDLGSSTFTLFTRDAGALSIGALAGGAKTSLRGASTSSSLTTYIIGAANGATTFGGAVLNGTYPAPVAITKVGTGTLTLTSTASNYSGKLTIANGVLATDQAGNLGGGTITLGNYSDKSTGTFRWTGGSLTISPALVIAAAGIVDASNVSGGLRFTGSVLYSGTTGTPRTVTLTGVNSALNSLEGVFSDNDGGSVTLIKSGGNTWQVTNTTNTFSGGTFVNGGTLIANGPSGTKPLGTGDLTVNNGGTIAGRFSLGSPGAAQRLTVNVGGVVCPGNDGGDAAIGAIFAPLMTLNGGAVLNLSLQDSPRAGDALTLYDGGTLDLGDSSASKPILLNLFDAAAPGTTAYAHNGTFAIFTALDTLSTDGAGHLTHLLGAAFAGDSMTAGALTNFRVLNLPPTLRAAFGVLDNCTSSSIVLTLSTVPPGALWTGSGRVGDWGDAANWTASVPGGTGGDAASFGAGTRGGTIWVNGPRHVATLTMEAGTNSGYALVAGTNGKLYLDNGTGAAAVSCAGIHSIAADVELMSATTLNVSAGTLTVTGVVSSSGAALAIGGAGRVILAGNNLHTGTTTITGVLQLGTGGGSGALGSGAIVNNGQLVIDRGDAAVVGNSISGGGTLTHAGTGTTTLTGACSAAGSVEVAAGQLSLAPTGAARNTPAVVLNCGILAVARNATLDVTNHDVIVGHTTLAAVEDMLLAGRGIGGAGAPAVTSATAQSLRTTFLVPVEADAWLGNGVAGSAVGKTWEGVTITQANTVLVKYTFIGDLNLDGVLDAADLQIAGGHFGEATPGTSRFFGGMAHGRRDVGWSRGRIGYGGDGEQRRGGGGIDPGGFCGPHWCAGAGIAGVVVAGGGAVVAAGG